MTLVADVDDLVSLIGHPPHLVVHLGDQRAHRIDHDPGPVLGPGHHLRRRPVGREHHRRPFGNLADVVDEDDAGPLEGLHHPLVVDDLVVAVDGRFEDPNHPGEGLDRHLDTGTEPARLG